MTLTEQIAEIKRLRADAATTSLHHHLGWNRFAFDHAVSIIEALEAQLPDGMKHCTILFKECEKGHGRLTAANWVQHDCQQCRITALEQERDRLKEQLNSVLACHELATGNCFDCRRVLEMAQMTSPSESWTLLMKTATELDRLKAENERLKNGGRE